MFGIILRKLNNKKYFLIIKRFLNDIKYLFMKDQYPNKIFCIGMNKTGTTSMQKALEDLGYKVGDQAEAEIIAIPTLKGKFSYLMNYCKASEAFQDVPFSRRNVYKSLDQRFPNSKFILTVRDDADTWYESLIRFHKKRLSKDGLPTRVRDSKKSIYRYKGWEYDMAKLVWLKGRKYFNEDFVRDETICKEYYNTHNKEAMEYFKGRDNFLVLNLKDNDAYNKFCEFIGRNPMYDRFPHENSSR